MGFNDDGPTARGHGWEHGRRLNGMDGVLVCTLFHLLISTAQHVEYLHILGPRNTMK